MMKAFGLIILVIATVVCLPQTVSAQASAADNSITTSDTLLADELLAATKIERGLFVIVADNTRLAKELVAARPVLVLIVASSQKVEAIRAELAATDIHGQVTVAAFGGPRLPLIDNMAAVVAVSADSQPAIESAELLRVVRPLGKLAYWKGGKWTVTEKPCPVGVDDWPQYHHDASMTDRSQDMLAGPAEGIQWLAGDNSLAPAKMGVRVVGSLIVLADERGVVVRDAYSGLPVWRRADLKLKNRYTFLTDEKRIYLIPHTGEYNDCPPYMTALDLRTGEDVLTYDEGIELGWKLVGSTLEENKILERTDREKAKAVQARVTKSYENVQARLDEGVLLQTRQEEMIALDAVTGRLLWSQCLNARSQVPDSRTGEQTQVRHQWHHPMILDGRVYAVEGEPARSWSYTHWPMGVVRTIHCFDLKTGDTKWTWKWPQEIGQPAAAYNMTPVGDWLGLMLRTDPTKSSPPAVVFVHRDGEQFKYAGETPYNLGWGKGIGGGHSHARLLFVDGKVWVNGTTNPIGAIDLSSPGDQALWNMTYAKLPRPVGCTVTRATPNYVFGSLTTYSLKENEIRHTNAARSVCDVGATPAAGMTFITPTQCFCAPYLPGYKAFHPRPFEGEEPIERLEKGQAKSAARSNMPSDWPMYMANARRSNWTEAKVPGPIEQLWSIRPVVEPADDPIVADWRDNWYTQGPATPVSIAEGVAVFALVDRQQIVAIDHVTGGERWRTTVDGRIDTSPTIKGGLVYVGTRNAWIYALNRDTGELVWRFFTAPRHDLMMSFGQLESRWPLHGTVVVADDGVWAIAGRHNDTDAGLWWWNLDAQTGRLIARGRLGSDELSSEVGVGLRSDGQQSGANTPIVTDGQLFLLAGIHLVKQDGRLVNRSISRGEGSEGEHRWWEENFKYDLMIPGNQGLVFDYTQMGGYKMPYYGFTQAPVYAYNGADFVHAGGTTTEQHRGGDRGGRRTMVTRFKKFDELKTIPHPTQQGRTMRLGAQPVWSSPYHESDGTGLGGLAVTADAVFIGFSVENSDHWRARDEMPHRLRSFDYETGQLRQEDLPLPDKPVLHGVTAGDGRVYVACEDGSIVCFGRK